MTVYLHNQRKEQVREFSSRAEAEDQKSKLVGLGMSPNDLEITTTDPRQDDESEQEVPPHDNHGEPIEKQADGGTEAVEVVDDEQPTEEPTPTQTGTDALEDAAEAVDKLQKNVDTDPLDVLPSYMITMVDGKPSLNKRGISVLAYHYDIDVKEREVVAYPHETEYETAVVEMMVEGPDGRTFTGIGEAHVDETPKHQLLRMAETRSYKRAVIFATGTGIVGYQEMVGSL